MSHIDKETLLDYKFELLEGDEAKAVSEHLEACEECRKALEAVADQFAQLDLIKDVTAEISSDLMASVQAMADEKLETGSVGDSDRPSSPKPFPAWRTLLAAAACLAFAAYLAFRPDAPPTTPVDVADNQTPDDTAGVGTGSVPRGGNGHAEDALKKGWGAKMESKRDALAAIEQPYFEPGSNIELNVLPRRDDVQLTIYNAADLTLVRETRKLTMKRGWNWLQYMWKNTLIDPTSLELKPIGVDGKVEVVQLVFPPRMTGVGRWLIKSEVSGQVECEITYFTSGIKWRAFYEGTLTVDETAMELKPYVRIDNGSGEEYDDAQTRLVVGQVNLYENIADLARRQYAYGRANEFVIERMFPESFEEPEFEANDDEAGFTPASPVFGRAKQVMKEGLSEYQLYTIEGRETIPNQWGKRLPASKPVMVPVKNLYKYDEDRWSNRVIRFVSFVNDKDHKLGDSPLPEGNVRVYGTAKPSNGSQVRSPSSLTYVGATQTKYIPVDEEVELELGPAQKVQVEPKLMKTETNKVAFDRWGNVTGWDNVQDWTVKLTNSRNVPVLLEITRNFNSQYWTLSQSNPGVRYEKHDMTHGRFELTLKPGQKMNLNYQLISKYGTNQK